MTTPRTVSSRMPNVVAGTNGLNSGAGASAASGSDGSASFGSVAAGSAGSAMEPRVPRIGRRRHQPGAARGPASARGEHRAVAHLAGGEAVARLVRLVERVLLDARLDLA